MVNVIVVANHLLLSLRLQRHDGHLLVGDVSVKNDFKSVVCLILSISLFIYLLISLIVNLDAWACLVSYSRDGHPLLEDLFGQLSQSPHFFEASVHNFERMLLLGQALCDGSEIL